MKTAIQQCAQDLFDLDLDMDLVRKITSILVKNMKLEKQQIENAYYSGTDIGLNYGGEDSENYYKKTFDK